MITKRSFKNVVWVDVSSPSREDLREIMEKYDIPPLVVEEMMTPTLKSKVDVYEGFIYLVLHFPAWKKNQKNAIQEIDFVISKNNIITVRYDNIEPLHKFGKMLEVNTVLGHNEKIGEHAGYMFFYMMREIYRSLHAELDFVKEDLGDIEKKIFQGKEKEMVREISNTSRELLAFKHAISLHDEILSSFETSASKMFSKEYIHHMEFISGEHARIDRSVSILSESLTELRETNNSLLDSKQNQIVTTLTVITFITSTLAIFISLFQVGAKSTPIINLPFGFWIISCIVIIIGIVFTIVFKNKKWL